MFCVSKTEMLCSGKDKENIDIEITKETSIEVIDLTSVELDYFIDCFVEGEDIIYLDDGCAYRISEFVIEDLEEWLKRENNDGYFSKEDVEKLKKVAKILQNYAVKGWKFIEY